MTLSEKAELALIEIQGTIPECQSVKFAGKWRKKDIFVDSTEYPEGTVFIGPMGIASVSDNGKAETITMNDITARDFPDILE